MTALYSAEEVWICLLLTSALRTFLTLAFGEGKLPRSFYEVTTSIEITTIGSVGQLTYSKPT